MKATPDDTVTMTTLGNNFEVTPEVESNCEEFVCHIYGNKQSKSVNRVRYLLFTKKTESLGRCLPPTASALKFHTLRANYQAGVWKRALKQLPEIPSPYDNGWKRSQNGPDPLWLDGYTAPKDILQFVSCGCKGNCNTNRCSCQKGSMQCTDVCRSSDTCENSQ